MFSFLPKRCPFNKENAVAQTSNIIFIIKSQNLAQINLTFITESEQNDIMSFKLIILQSFIASNVSWQWNSFI